MSMSTSHARPPRRKMIIDTDTASDDAVAIMMALKSPGVEVIALTIVAGNVDVAQASVNARYTVELCGAQLPVYEGCHVPLVRERHDATFFHGKDGMGNMYYPAPEFPAQSEPAVSALIRLIRDNPGIELVTLGPMTNVATAITQAPDIVSLISRCVVMGGTANTIGNITPAAEYNIWCDPEAARICFRSGLQIEMVGWELSRFEANLLSLEVQHYKNHINTPLSHFVIDCNRASLKVNQDVQKDPGISLPDPVAMAIALDPSICTRSSKHYVEIECDGTFTRGMTVVDQLDVARLGSANVSMWQVHRDRGEPTISVCWEIDVPKWKSLLESCVW